MLLIDEFQNYDKIKELILSATTLDQVKKIVSDYENINKNYYNNLERILIYSLVDEKRFVKKISEEHFTEYVQQYDINTLLKMTEDSAQIQVIKKFSKPNYNITKNCPHCGNPFNGTDGINYVICGYTNNLKGYDWIGCKKDWCFKCGGKLCKSWDDNELYLENNRKHTSECCKRYSKLKGINYDNFCFCKKT